MEANHRHRLLLDSQDIQDTGEKEKYAVNIIDTPGLFS